MRGSSTGDDGLLSFYIISQIGRGGPMGKKIQLSGPTFWSRLHLRSIEQKHQRLMFLFNQYVLYWLHRAALRSTSHPGRAALALALARGHRRA